MRTSDFHQLLSPEAVTSYQDVLRLEWKGGIPLPELIDRVNRVAKCLARAPGPHDSDSRVKHFFTERSFRRYQTLGCIDPPEKDGKTALYLVRQFTQAILIRKLLWNGMSADQIVSTIAHRTTDELAEMFLGEIEVVLKPRNPTAESDEPFAQIGAEVWNRIRIAPGVELHLHNDLRDLKREQVRCLLQHLQNALGTDK